MTFLQELHDGRFKTNLFGPCQEVGTPQIQAILQMKGEELTAEH